MDDCIPLKQFLRNNHICTVIDLEERELEIVKFISGSERHIDYIEVDATHNKAKLKSVNSKEFHDKIKN